MVSATHAQNQTFLSEYWTGQGGELAVTDIVGHKIASYNLSNHSSGQQSITIHLSNLANGMYVCTLKMGEKSVSKRIIKN